VGREGLVAAGGVARVSIIGVHKATKVSTQAVNHLVSRTGNPIKCLLSNTLAPSEQLALDLLGHSPSKVSSQPSGY
jgi:hypothetical protein